MSRERDQHWNDAYGDPRAAEYVLGTLPADERAEFAELIDRDRTVADAVDAWARHLAPMNGAYGEINAPSSVKAAIDRRLFAGPAVAAAREGRWRWWPFALGSASGVAVAFLILLALPFAGLSPLWLSPPPATQARMVASLAPHDSDAGFVALYEAGSRTLNMTRVSGGAPDRGVYEVWVIDEGADPVSLGVLPEDDIAHMVMPEAKAKLMSEHATLAISWEPEGGSPSGLPTGPVVAAGPVRSI